MESINTSELEIRQRVEKVACANCGRHFRFDELGAVASDADDRSYIVCSRCGARNEIRAEPRAGLGTQPAARVVGIIGD